MDNDILVDKLWGWNFWMGWIGLIGLGLMRFGLIIGGCG